MNTTKDGSTYPSCYRGCLSWPNRFSFQSNAGPVPPPTSCWSPNRQGMNSEKNFSNLIELSCQASELSTVESHRLEIKWFSSGKWLLNRKGTIIEGTWTRRDKLLAFYAPPFHSQLPTWTFFLSLFIHSDQDFPIHGKIRVSGGCLPRYSSFTPNVTGRKKWHQQWVRHQSWDTGLQNEIPKGQSWCSTRIIWTSLCSSLNPFRPWKPKAGPDRKSRFTQCKNSSLRMVSEQLRDLGTEVAFVLLAQRPWMNISALLIFLISLVRGSNQSRAFASFFASAVGSKDQS